MLERKEIVLGRRGAILAEIQALYEQINEYRRDIEELEEERFCIRQQYTTIDEVNKSVIHYDMTYGDDWKGNLETEAEEYREEIYYTTDTALNEMLELIDDINRIIEAINELIEKCYAEIEELEAELASLTEE
ncbi:protein of unknown function [Butyrivibrio sp. INlla18]|nr:protein of unknown function [Butyrivibrio sp. INlla18]